MREQVNDYRPHARELQQQQHISSGNTGVTGWQVSHLNISEGGI
jgi:hypothetical protein